MNKNSENINISNEARMNNILANTRQVDGWYICILFLRWYDSHNKTNIRQIDALMIILQWHDV